MSSAARSHGSSALSAWIRPRARVANVFAFELICRRYAVQRNRPAPYIGESLRLLPSGVISASADELSRKNEPDTGIDPYDEVNPSKKTLPPPLRLPAGDSAPNRVVYWFRVGRAYGSFYWAGLKAAWYNHREEAPFRRAFAKAVGKRYGLTTSDLALRALDVKYGGPTSSCLSPSDEVHNGELVHLLRQHPLMTRARYQSLVREEEDFSKLPRFAILVALFGEYIPLLVPFMPNVVPRTARIPSQIEGMRKDREGRRKQGHIYYQRRFGEHEQDAARSQRRVEESAVRKQALEVFRKRSSTHKISEEPFSAVAKYARVSPQLSGMFIRCLPTQLLYRLSLTFGLHSKLWDRLGLVPPRWLLLARVERQSRYLLIDDLLLREARAGVSALSDDEVTIACDDRAIPVTSRSVEELKKDLQIWLQAAFEYDGLHCLYIAGLLPWDHVRVAHMKATEENMSLDEATNQVQAGPVEHL